MRFLLFGLLVTGALCSAVPPKLGRDDALILFSRATSPDNTCGITLAGANNNYTCSVAAGNAGPCCSGSGWCGNTTDYCGSGCQTAFGAGCNPEASISNTNTCGVNNGKLSCTGGLCCSGAGWCGNSTDYCLASNGCQPTFGACNQDAPPPSIGGVCGPQNGNSICGNNQCCSVSGFCGTGPDYCSDPNNCAPGFGVCDSSTTPTGPSTQNVARPLLGSVSYSEDVTDCVSNKVVALSFDDGPYLYTAQLLDLLKTYGYTATFFITGNNNGRGAIDNASLPYPAVIKRMIAEGHQVASHTWSHYSLDNSSQALRISQMVKNEMALNNIIGKWPTYMRPPYSECNSAACQADMQSLGYHRILFDLDTQDYLNPLPTQIQNSKDIVSAALKVPGVTDYLSIQHDIVQQSVTNLSSYYFDQIKSKGWKGVTVGSCLGDPQANWYRSLPPSTGSTTTLPTVLPTDIAATSSIPNSVVPTPTLTTTPTASAKCDSIIGKYCGKIATFTSAATCAMAASTCRTGYVACVVQNGIGYAVKCIAWTQKCNDMTAYCMKCGKTCSNAGLGLATLG